MTDEEIDVEDAPLLPDDFWERAELRLPGAERRAVRRKSVVTVAVSVAMDADVLAWFVAQGAGYEQRMRAALRQYAESHKPAA